MDENMWRQIMAGYYNIEVKGDPDFNDRVDDARVDELARLLGVESVDPNDVGEGIHVSGAEDKWYDLLEIMHALTVRMFEFAESIENINSKFTTIVDRLEALERREYGHQS
jgi:hypothetical protein